MLTNWIISYDYYETTQVLCSHRKHSFHHYRYSIHRVTVVRYIERRPGLYIQINFRHRSFHRLISVAHAVALYDQSASQIFNGVDVIHLGGAAWRGAESQDEPVRRLYSRRRCSGGERAFVR